MGLWSTNLGDFEFRFDNVLLPMLYLGNVALLPHNTLKSEVRFWDLVFLCNAGGPGNPCNGVQAHLVNFALSSFALHFKVLCESKAMLLKV